MVLKDYYESRLKLNHYQSVARNRGITDDWPMMLHPKDVLTDFLFVTKTFKKMLVFLIANKGLMVNKHSKSITKSKFKL